MFWAPTSKKVINNEKRLRQKQQRKDKKGHLHVSVTALPNVKLVLLARGLL